MKVFFIIDEARPLYKVGGLGDVGGSLPIALTNLGIDTSIVLPKHPKIDTIGFTKEDNSFQVVYDNETLNINVYKGLFPDSSTPIYLIEEEKYISTNSPSSKNHADKYSVFSLAVSHWVNTLPDTDKPEIIHLNDWHTAMIPVISTHLYKESNIKYIISIHNLMYQGVTNTPILQKLKISPLNCRVLSDDIKDENVNILLEGLLHTDIINTVSPTYAKEILTSEYGEKINELLVKSGIEILGILNGLDINTFNPETDQQIYKNYSAINVLEGKIQNKLQLQKQLGLDQGENKMMAGFIGRVDPGQKGIQLIIEAIEKNILVNGDQQFVFLGVGDPKLEQHLHKSSSGRFNIRIITRYDEQMAARIYAASDLLLIPSKFEPCGLIQMIAMRYGTLPVARSTGGLKDTIDDSVNGFLFDDYSVEAMVGTLQKSFQVISDHRTKIHMIQSAMSKDFSWDESAKKYQQLFEKILHG